MGKGPRVLNTAVLLLALAVNFSGAHGEEEQKPPAKAVSDQPDSRFERLLEERRKRLAAVKPAEPSKVAELLATIENDGFDQIVSVQTGHWRFGFGKISPISGGTPAIQYERPRLGGSGVRLRTAGAYSFRFLTGGSIFMAARHRLGSRRQQCSG